MAKERELTLSADTNTDPVVLSEEQQSDVLKKVNEIYHAVVHLHNKIKENKLEVGFKNTLLSLCEYHLSDLCKLLNYDAHITKELERRHSEIRNVHTENRELRKQLGMKLTNEDAMERMKLMIESVRNWWNKEGTGYFKDEKFTGYSFWCTLSGHISSIVTRIEGYSYDEHVKKLIDFGFTFNKEPDNRDLSLLDTESNRNLLTKLLTSKYPSAEIIKSNNYFRRGGEAPELWEVEIVIRDLNDIEISLPAKEKTTNGK